MTANRPAHTSAIGPYCSPLALAKLDGRTREAALMRRVRAELTAHVGGHPTFPQKCLIERAAVLALRIAQIDLKMLAGEPLKHRCLARRDGEVVVRSAGGVGMIRLTQPIRASISPATAINDPDLLGPAFAGDSWATWRAVLKAAYGEPLSPSERLLFHTVAGDRDPPRDRVRELWVIAGRRSGKDSIASAVATTTALTDYRRFLRPGERASVLCLAVDRAQAKIVNRYVRGYFQTIPLLQRLALRESDDGLELNNACEVVVATNSFRAVRGRTIAAVILDEVAFWRDEDSANPDVETYNALVPGLVTLPGAMLIGIANSACGACVLAAAAKSRPLILSPGALKKFAAVPQRDRFAGMSATLVTRNRFARVG